MFLDAKDTREARNRVTDEQMMQMGNEETVQGEGEGDRNKDCSQSQNLKFSQNCKCTLRIISV